MPFKSAAQNAWAHTLAGTKALGGKKKVKEWERGTDYARLPKHVKMHEGGEILEDGVYELEKGEVVIPKDAGMKGMKGMKKKHDFRSTNMEHHADGSITLRHMHESDSKKDVTQAVANLAKAHKAMDMHLGEGAEPVAEEAAETPAMEASEKLPLGFLKR